MQSKGNYFILKVNTRIDKQVSDATPYIKIKILDVKTHLFNKLQTLLCQNRTHLTTLIPIIHLVAIGSYACLVQIRIRGDVKIKSYGNYPKK